MSHTNKSSRQLKSFNQYKIAVTRLGQIANSLSLFRAIIKMTIKQ